MPDLRGRESDAERLTLAPPTPALKANELGSSLLVLDREAWSREMDLDLTSGAGGAGVGPAAKPEPKNALVLLVVDRGLPPLSLAVGDNAPGGDPIPRGGEPNRRFDSVGEGRGDSRVVGGARWWWVLRCSPVRRVVGEFWTVSEPVPATDVSSGLSTTEDASDPRLEYVLVLDGSGVGNRCNECGLGGNSTGERLSMSSLSGPGVEGVEHAVVSNFQGACGCWTGSIVVFSAVEVEI